MADGRHFENSFIAISQSEIIRFQRNLVRRCRLWFQGRLLNKMLKKIQIQNGGRPPHWKSSFGYISTNDYPINAKFCRMKQNHVLTQILWPKYQISKIQDGGWPPFWKWFYRYIWAENHIRFKWNLVCRCRLCFQSRLLNKMLKFCKFKMADGRHIENRLLAISQRVIIGLTRNFVEESRMTF